MSLKTNNALTRCYRLKCKLFIIFFFVVFNLKAQNIKYKTFLGPRIELGPKGWFTNTGVKIDSNLFLLKQFYKLSGHLTYQLESYNNRLFLEKTSMLDIDKKADWSLCLIANVNKRLLLFSRLRDKDSAFLFCEEINQKNLQLSRSKKTLAHIPIMGYRNGHYQIIFSPDSSKLLVNAYHYTDKGEIGLRKFVLFDNNLNLLWEKTFNHEEYIINDLRVDNDGNVYMLKQEIAKIKHNKYYKYSALEFTYKQDGVIEFPIEIPEGTIGKLQLELLGNHKIFCAGYYSKARPQEVSGVLFLKVDLKLNQLISKTVHNFDEGFLVRASKKSIVSDNGRGLVYDFYNYVIDELIMGPDESFTLIAEQRSVELVNNQTSMFRSNHIIIIKVDKLGQVVWIRKIQKRGYTFTVPPIGSYVLSNVNNDLYFIFNDHIKNQNLAKSEIPTDYNWRSDSEIAVVKIDKDGNLTRSKIFNPLEYVVYSSKDLSKQIKRNEILLLIRKFDDPEFHFANITFE